MIHHISIPAHDPKHVAEVLAELIGGHAYPFPGPLEGGFMAVSGDDHGTMIETYPETIRLEPGAGEDDPNLFNRVDDPTPTTTWHAYISVDLTQQEIEAIGKREGWKTKLFGRGAPGQRPMFHVIEFWVENRVLLEVVTNSLLPEYLNVLRPASLEAMFA